MTLDTRLANHTKYDGDIVTKDTGGYEVIRRVNGSSFFLGAIVTIKDETLPDVGLCASGEVAYGIIRSVVGDTYDASHDSDDTLDDNTKVNIYVPSKGSKALITAKTNSDITQGEKVAADGGYAIEFSYSDASEATDTETSVIGLALDNITGASSTEKIFEVRFL